MACRFKAVPGDPVPSVPEACQLGHGHVATFTSDSVVCSLVAKGTNESRGGNSVERQLR